ncbi:MAG: TonB-dependent siderophore receptor [Cellvibrio sp.]|uniref:TonB-dependent siderophore receptor n=1 Tax=Cellvibrio sp. TaxID=1965322 RepID=UPI0031B32A28
MSSPTSTHAPAHNRRRFACHPLTFALHAIWVGAVFNSPFALQEAHAQETQVQQVQTQSQAVKSYDIPAGLLSTALTQFISTSGIYLASSAELTKGKTTQGLSGNYSVEAGLNKLLEGTDLEAVLQNDGYKLQKSNLVKLTSVKVSAQGLTNTEDSHSYATTTATFGKGMTLRETPQTVSVVTRQRMDEQGLQTLNNVLDQTTGLSWTQGTSDNSTIYSRGFAIGSVRLDGGSPMSWEGPGYVSGFNNIDMAAYDSIEVLRGADGLFSGGGEPGGVINLVRKRPSSENRLQVNAAVGSWQQYRAEMDVTGPLTESKALRGRFVAVLNDREFFYDTAESEKHMLYGILEYDLAEATTLTFGGISESRDDKPFRNGLMRYSNGADLKLPRSTSFIPDWNRHEVKEEQLFSKVEHRFNEDWTLKLDSTWMERSRDTKVGAVTTAIDPVTLKGSSWFGTVVNNSSEQLSVDLNLTGHFDAWGYRHKVLLGTDYQDEEGRWDSLSGNLFTSVIPFDVFNPPSVNIAEPETRLGIFVDPMERTQNGIYGAVQLQLLDKLKLVTGGRYNDYEYNFRETGSRGETITRYDDSGVFTPYGGLIYDINNRVSLYGSVAETYVSQASRLSGPLPGEPLDPITGKNFELGVKSDWLENRITASLALYRIEREGEAVRDPDYTSVTDPDGGNCCWVAQGERLSKGIDVEINGEILPRWHLFAGYTWNDNEDKKAAIKRFSSVTPKHLFKLWSTWRFDGSLSKLTLGGGVTAQSSQYVTGTVRSLNPITDVYDGPTVPFEYTQSGYAVWSLFGDYRLTDNWTTSLKVNNVFDKKYYQTMGSSNSSNWYGEPVNTMLTLRGNF